MRIRKLRNRSTPGQDLDNATDDPRAVAPANEANLAGDDDDLAQHVDESAPGPDDATENDEAAAAQTTVRRSRTNLHIAIAAALVMVVSLAGLSAWLGHQVHKASAAQHQRDVFLQVGRQAAVNLTTISDTDADVDVKRIRDSATGAFRDEFAQRAPAFIDVVKQARTTTRGTVTAAGLESVNAGQAQVLVTVSVTTSNVGAAEQPPRSWRMRIGVVQEEGGAKVADVQFVP